MTPTTRDPTFNAATVQGANTHPFFQDMSFTVNGNPMIHSCILILLLKCRPSQISLFVVSVVINSIKGIYIVSGAFTNFSIKLFKRVKAKFDSTSAIIRITRMIQISTTSARIVVKSILRRISTSVGFRKRFYIFSEASTRLAFFVSQGVTQDGAASATNTLTHPLSITIIMRNHPTTKDLISNINTTFLHNKSLYEQRT